MVSFTKGLFYLGLFLFVTVAIHEVGHLVVARRLISEGARVRLFPSFPFGGMLGYVTIPESASCPPWKGFAVALAGPLLATILMFVIWLNTKDPLIAVISSFFAVHQLAYSFMEPALFLGIVPTWALWIPLLAGCSWVLPYAYHIRENLRDWD